MQHFVYCYGPYISHLMAVVEDQSNRGSVQQRIIPTEDQSNRGSVQQRINPTEDQSNRADDWACLRSYHFKWKQCRMLITATLFVDVLKPAPLLSMNSQPERHDIVQGVQAILKFAKRRMTGQDPFTGWWSSWFVVGWRRRIKASSTKALFCIAIQPALSSLVQNKLVKMQRDWRIRWERATSIVWHHDAQSNDRPFDTQNWCVVTRSCYDDEQGEDEDVLAELKAAMEYIIALFWEPLVAKCVALACIHDKLEKVVYYTRK